MRNIRLSLAAAAALAVLPALALPAAAEPAFPAITANSPGIVHVQYAYPGYYGYNGYYGPGPYYGGGLLDIPGEIVGGTAGIATGILGAPYGGAYAAPYAGGGIAACQRRFRSFNPATGTYTTYTGEQVVCPYLGG